MVLSGASVEYLFGEDEVQAEARHLVDGRTALSVAHRAVAEAVFLTLDRPAALSADGCLLLAGPCNLRPRLSPFEVAALRQSPGRAA